MSYTNNSVRYPTATIAASEALSGAVAVGRSSSVYGIVMPAAWTAASLTFQGSVDGTNFFNIFDNASEWTETVGTSRIVMIDPTLTESLLQIKIRSGTNATPVNQAEERTLTLIVRDND